MAAQETSFETTATTAFDSGKEYYVAGTPLDVQELILMAESAFRSGYLGSSDASGYPNLPDTRVPGHFWATRYPTFHAGRVPGSTRYPTLKTRVPGGYLTDLKLPEIVLQKA